MAVQEAKVEADGTRDVEAAARNIGWKVSIEKCGHGEGANRLEWRWFADST